MLRILCVSLCSWCAIIFAALLPLLKEAPVVKIDNLSSDEQKMVVAALRMQYASYMRLSNRVGQSPSACDAYKNDAQRVLALIAKVQ